MLTLRKHHLAKYLRIFTLPAAPFRSQFNIILAERLHSGASAFDRRPPKHMLLMFPISPVRAPPPPERRGYIRAGPTVFRWQTRSISQAVLFCSWRRLVHPFHFGSFENKNYKSTRGGILVRTFIGV